MKWAAVALPVLLVAGVVDLTSAQTVSGRAPVVVPAQYVSASSPMSDGRTVRTTFTADSNQNVTVTTEPYRVPAGSAIQAAPNGTSSWQTVQPRYVVAPDSVSTTSTTVQSVQPAPPTISRYPVSRNAVPPTVVYYVQGNNGHVVHAPAGSATAAPTTVYQVLGTDVEATQVPSIDCPAPSAAYAPPVVATPANTIYRPVLPLRRSIDGAYVSRGIWGQPKAYVPSEPVRNFFRYMLP